MIGIFVGLVLVVKFATSPQLQEAIIDQAITNDPDVAHLYNRHHVAIWSWLLSGVFTFGLGKSSKFYVMYPDRWRILVMVQNVFQSFTPTSGLLCTATTTS